MKVVVTPTSFFSEQNKQALQKLEGFAEVIVKNPLSRPLEAEELLPLLEGADGYVAGLDYVTGDVIRRAPQSLKVISRYGAGYDRVDIEVARERGIIVTNTPGANCVAVCELAFGLMLALARSLPSLDMSVKRGEWVRSNGTELLGKTLGIVGFGAIGKELARRAASFGMRVLAFDPYFDDAFAKQFAVTQGALDEIFKQADFISLHLPLTVETRHIINADSIAKMKKGVKIINTARGGLVDEQAAAQALDTQQIGGLALDVFEDEPPKNRELLHRDHVILTPHTGAHTNEAVAKMGMLAVENLISVLSGKTSACQIT